MKTYDFVHVKTKISQRTTLIEIADALIEFLSLLLVVSAFGFILLLVHG